MIRLTLPGTGDNPATPATSFYPLPTFLANPTSFLSVTINLPATDTQAGWSGSPYTWNHTYTTPSGTIEEIILHFTPIVPQRGVSNTWIMSVSDSSVAGASVAEYQLTFHDNRIFGGTLASVETLSGGVYDPVSGGMDINLGHGPITLLIGKPDTHTGLTQFSDFFAPFGFEQDGHLEFGEIDHVAVDADGAVRAVFDSGLSWFVQALPMAALTQARPAEQDRITLFDISAQKVDISAGFLRSLQTEIPGQNVGILSYSEGGTYTRVDAFDLADGQVDFGALGLRDAVIVMDSGGEGHGTDGSSDVLFATASHLIGTAGNDRFAISGSDDANMSGGTGDDIFVTGLGNDHFEGGDGRDLVSYAAAYAGVEVYLELGKARGAGGYDRLTDIEDARGSNFNDRLVGDAQDNNLNGGAGNDILLGRAGNDTLHGHLGDDWLKGGAGDDNVFGGTGDDILFGGAGNDLISGSDGADYLYAGAGADIMSGGHGRDNLYGNKGGDKIYGGDGDDHIEGGGNGDWLYGEAGRDWIVGGGGADYI